MDPMPSIKEIEQLRLCGNHARLVPGSKHQAKATGSAITTFDEGNHGRTATYCSFLVKGMDV